MATTTAMPAPEPQSQAAISPVGRIIGMFFSPGATFADIVRKPSWIAPLAVIVALSLVGVIALNSHFDWRGYITQQIEKNPRAANLSPDQKQQQIDGGVKMAPMFAYVFGIPAPIVMLLVVALVLWGAYNLMAGAGVNFAQSFAIVTHAWVPISVMGSLIFLLVLFIKPVGSFDLDNPVATNLAVLLPDDAAKWLVALCKNIDLFEIWKLILLGMGFAAVSPRKLKGGKSYTIVFGAFAVWVLCRVAWGFISS
jgi:hypothetical protein